MLIAPSVERVAAHLFTTRHWKLGSATTDANDDDGWSRVAEAAGVGLSDLVRAEQVHGNVVVAATRGAPRAAADIIVNADPTIAIAVQTADCAPILYADPRTGAVAAAHAGWRGLAARVPETAAESLTGRFGTRAEDLVVVLGPSIGACCYEVGVDVRDAFIRAGFGAAQIERWFSMQPKPSVSNASMGGLSLQRRSGHWFFDGWASAHEQLRAAGVRSDRIFASELCTASHDSAFCSYRRDGAPAGRMAGVIKPLPRP